MACCVCVVWARLRLNGMTQGQRLVLLMSGHHPWSHRTNLRVSQPGPGTGCHRHDVVQPRAWQRQVTAPVESTVFRIKEIVYAKYLAQSKHAINGSHDGYYY